MLSPELIEQCALWACEQEVSAPKPGNVNSFSGNHQMVVADFIKSAHAIAPIMANSDLSVGDLILQSISATREAVNCNTNLGIVLLFAPLCKAMHQCCAFEELANALEQVLNNLSVDDAEKCYQAIGLANAGGIGKIEDQDINDRPTITLKQAMAIAQQRDTIARQYINNYDAIWSIGLPSLIESLNCGETVEWATTFAYLMLLSKIPDTLISRKNGQAIAEEVSTGAHSLVKKIKEYNRLSDIQFEIIKWDNELKKDKLNPGTSADLTAATLLVYAFQQLCLNTEF